MALEKLCAVSDIPENGVKAFKIGGLDIAVFNIAGEFYAIDRKCTHFGGNLAKGSIEGKTVKCPLHGATYNLETGELLKPAGTIAGRLKKARNTNIYKIEVKDDALFIDIDI